jgi:hypothetical protein
MIGGYFFVACAICAKRFAKRKMQINAEPFCARRGALKLPVKIHFPFIAIRQIIPERNGRVAGITGHRLIIFIDKRIEILHVCQLKLENIQHDLSFSQHMSVQVMIIISFSVKI